MSAQDNAVAKLNNAQNLAQRIVQLYYDIQSYQAATTIASPVTILQNLPTAAAITTPGPLYGTVSTTLDGSSIQTNPIVVGGQAYPSLAQYNKIMTDLATIITALNPLLVDFAPFAQINK